MRRSVTRPLVSVVVPVHRMQIAFLEACLDSVSAQTAADSCELVVVDDASGPSYATALDRVLSRFDGSLPVRRVALARRARPGGARAAGFEASTGRYIHFLDSDDMLAPEAIETVTPLLRAGCALAFTDEARVEPDGRNVISVRDKRAYAALLREYAGTPFDPLVHSTFVVHGQFVRREELEAIGGPRTDVPYGDEMDTPIRIAEVAGPESVAHVPRTLYLYRRNPRSVVHQADEWKLIVRCIERIVLEGAQRRGIDVVRAVRLGRAKPFDITHYALFDASGEQLRAPYVDYEELSLRSLAVTEPDASS
jgi:glycosyltransferase involved in cell wall biosynthesis